MPTAAKLLKKLKKHGRKEDKMEKLYMCVGENFKDNIRIGFCGDVHTLGKWIQIIYGEKGTEYFEGVKEKEIIDYILQFAGKRLKVKKSLC